MVVFWAVTLGGNMQTPVISFFYQDIGMTPVEIGTTGIQKDPVYLLGKTQYIFNMTEKKMRWRMYACDSICVTYIY